MSYEDARAEREFRKNPPESAPGQGSEESWGTDWDDMQPGSSSVEDLAESNIEGIGSTLNTPNANTPTNNNKSDFASLTSTEDKFFEILKIVATGVFNYLKLLATSLTNNTAGDWHALGDRIFKCSSLVAATGVIFVILCKFLGSQNDPLDLVIGSLVSMIVGIFLLMFFKADGSERNDEIKEDPISDDDWSGSTNYAWEEGEAEEYDSSEVTYEEEYEEPESEGSTWGSILSEGSSLFEEDNDTSIQSDGFSVETALKQVPEIIQGTQTRQFLFETFSKVLPMMTPNFAEMKQISEASDEFYLFEDYLRSAAAQVGTKEENIPELVSVCENPFIYRLSCTRPVGLKEQQIADEIASTYSRDNNNIVYRVGVYATIETSINVYIINLFKGMLADPQKQKPVTISLGDVYKEISGFISDPSIQMPYVWGINELGKTIYCDAIDVNSIIVSGEPRGGKSWKGQSIIAQLTMFNSPKEIELYFFDTKNNASDYRHLSGVLPHAKYFCGDPMKVNKGLELIIDKTVEETGNIITEAGYKNIKDYNKNHPDKKLPYRYVVVDEMMGLMDYFNNNDLKDEASKFRGNLSIMVSKLANLGIRVILFPHRIVDYVIAKNTYELISCRAVVNQLNEEALKAAVGVSKKAFPYSLAQKGDMALVAKEVNGGKPSFCHAEILSTSNEANDKLFDFIGSVWKKLEPDCECITFNGAIGGKITINKQQTAVQQGKPTARDNTEGETEYMYTGYSDVGSLDNGDFEDTTSDVDEDFWNNFM